MLTWAQRNAAEPLTVEMLAARAHMSPRSFARRFRGSAAELREHFVRTRGVPPQAYRRAFRIPPAPKSTA